MCEFSKIEVDAAHLKSWNVELTKFLRYIYCVYLYTCQIS